MPCLKHIYNFFKGGSEKKKEKQKQKQKKKIECSRIKHTRVM